MQNDAWGRSRASGRQGGLSESAAAISPPLLVFTQQPFVISKALGLYSFEKEKCESMIIMWPTLKEWQFLL